MKPTPTPWTLGRVNKRSQTTFIDAMHPDPEMGHKTWQEMIQCNGCYDLPDKGIEKAEANARHIVKAVNYHDRLLEALKSVDWDKAADWGIVAMDGRDSARALLAELDNLEKQQ